MFKSLYYPTQNLYGDVQDEILSNNESYGDMQDSILANNDYLKWYSRFYSFQQRVFTVTFRILYWPASLDGDIQDSILANES